MSEDLLKELRVLFDKAMALTDSEDYDDADQVWQAYDQLLYGEDLPGSFDDYDLDDKDKAKAQDLLDKALSLEEAGKYDQADKVWEELNKLLGIENAFDEHFGMAESFEAAYRVKDGKIVLSTDPMDYDGMKISKPSPAQQAIHQKIWVRLMRIIPKDYLKYMDVMKFGTDGEGGMAAYVVQTSSLAKWAMFVDLKDNVNGDKLNEYLNETLIHEFAHIVTLNNSQIDANKKENNIYVNEEGYSKSTSYINKFYQTFWKDLDKSSTPESRYYNNPNHFVTDYAATNVEEDMAESFAYFVTRDKMSGSELKDKKVNFYYQFPELVQLRTTIRKNLSL